MHMHTHTHTHTQTHTHRCIVTNPIVDKRKRRYCDAFVAKNASVLSVFSPLHNAAPILRLGCKIVMNNSGNMYVVL